MCLEHLVRNGDFLGSFDPYVREAGPAVELIHKYGLDAEGIYKKIKASL